MIDTLTSRILPFLHEKSHLQAIDYLVDFSIFGAMQLEVVKCNPRSVSEEGYAELKRLGLHYADHQWAEPDPSTPYRNGNAPYEIQLKYFENGYSPQTRLWIDDMYMINVLQTQAYRVACSGRYFLFIFHFSIAMSLG